MRTIFGNRKLLTEMQGQELDPRHLHLHCHRVHEKGSKWPRNIRFWRRCRVRSWIPEILTYIATMCMWEGVPMASLHSLLTGMQGQELDPRDLHLHCHQVHEKGSQWPRNIRFWQGCRVRNWIPDIFTYTATMCMWEGVPMASLHSLLFIFLCVCVGGFLDFILTILLLLTPPPNSGHFGLFMLIKQRGCVITHPLLVF